MAWVFDVNNVSTWPNFYEIMWILKEAMVASGGWVVQASGSGMLGTYNATGDCWAAADSQSRGAWIRIQHTASGMELLFQNYTASTIPYMWGGWFSQSAPFTGGTPDKDSVPTAVGSTVLYPMVTNTFINAPQHWHIITENVAPHRFFFGAGAAGSPYITTGCFMEAMESGTYPAANTFPYIVSFGYNSGGNVVYGSAFNANTTPDQYTVVRQGEVDEVVQQVWTPIMTANSKQVWPAASYDAPGINPYTDKVDVIPLAWMIPASQAGTSGWVGYSSTFRGILADRIAGTTFDLDGGTKNWVTWSRGVILPWNGEDMRY